MHPLPPTAYPHPPPHYNNHRDDNGGGGGGGVISTLRRRPIQTAALLILFLILLHLNNNGSSSITSHDGRRTYATNTAALSSRLAEPGTAYGGTLWHNERTVEVETLGETKFARCDVHTVMSEDGTSTIDDCIFLEELPAVNVIVQTLE